MKTLLTRAFALLFLVTATALHAQVPQLINYQGRVVVGTTNFTGSGQFKFALVSSGVSAAAQATAAATVNSGFVTSIAVTNAGSTYVAAPAVIITGVGTGATATANLTGGSVSSITVNAPGTGYSSAPIVTLAAPPPGAYVTFWSNDGTSTAGSQPTSAVPLGVTNGLYSVLLGNPALANMTPVPASVFNNPDVRLRVWFNDGVNNSQLLSPDQRFAATGSAMIAANVSDNAITTAKLADGAVTGPKFATPFSLSGTTGVGGTIFTGTNTASNGTGLAGVSTSGRGVFGTTATGNTSVAGVCGETTAIGGTGVVGNVTNVNSAGVSGIGDTSGSTGVYGRGNNFGVFGSSSTASTTTAGVWGENTAAGGTGVVGKALAANGGGVSGIGDIAGSTGVYGRGANLGVFGTTTNGTGVSGNSTGGRGVYGISAAASTTIAGVWGENAASGGTGVVGKALAANGGGVTGIGDVAGSTGVYGRGATLGVFGTSTNGTGVSGNSSGGRGVFGTTSAGNPTIAGVWGENTAVGGTGVVGNAANTSSAGVAGIGDTSFSTGVYGRGAANGVSGNSTSGNGVYGGSGSGYGVFGQSTSGDGVYGTTDGNGSGVYGETFSTNGYGDGVRGVSHGGNHWGVHGITSGSGYAGYFDGPIFVTGDIRSSGTKFFKIDHPLDPANKYLLHACIESPDAKNLYDGTITTDGNGEATIALPSYFEALNRDFRYQLTVLGQFAQAIVAREIAESQFTIKTDKPNVKVSWQVTGIRHDAYMEAHPMVVEQDKTPEERGTYQHPELFGQPEEKGLSWKQNPELWKRLKAERLKREAGAKAKTK